jgi:biopolymer transport protein ExbD
LFISLGTDGKILVSLGMGPDATGSSVDMAGVPAAVQSLIPAAELPTKETYIRADFDVPYSGVMQLLNRLRDSGLKKIGLVGEATS